MSGYHDGHRQRLKKRFLKEDLDGFEPHEVLELILFYAIPRRDTNDLAHRLIQYFGDITAVFDAEVPELCEVEGIGENAAVLIKLFASGCRYYLNAYNKKGAVIQTTEQAVEYLRPKFIGRSNRENICVLFLDNKGRVSYCDIVGEGTINMASVYIRNIVELALRFRVVSVIFSHNHPRGLVNPSNADISVTHELYQALKTVQIKLTDHIIFTETDFLSMRSFGYFSFEDGHTYSQIASK